MEPALKSKRSIMPTHTDFTKCVICQLSRSGEEVSQLTKKGISTFKDTLHPFWIRVYDRLWVQIQDTDSFLSKQPVYHRGCRSTFTHKQKLEMHLPKKMKIEEDIQPSPCIAFILSYWGSRRGFGWAGMAKVQSRLSASFVRNHVRNQGCA